jgi:hypothetical protein
VEPCYCHVLMSMLQGGGHGLGFNAEVNNDLNKCLRNIYDLCATHQRQLIIQLFISTISVLFALVKPLVMSGQFSQRQQYRDQSSNSRNKQTNKGFKALTHVTTGRRCLTRLVFLYVSATKQVCCYYLNCTSGDLNRVTFKSAFRIQRTSPSYSPITLQEAGICCYGDPPLSRRDAGSMID